MQGGCVLLRGVPEAGLGAAQTDVPAAGRVSDRSSSIVAPHRKVGRAKRCAAPYLCIINIDIVVYCLLVTTISDWIGWRVLAVAARMVPLACKTQI